MTARSELAGDRLIATGRLEAPPARARAASTTPAHRAGITTEVRREPSGTGTTVVVHQRRLPPELRTDHARTGLAGILDRPASGAAGPPSPGPQSRGMAKR
ncbi:MAG TPA: hypothetical protein VIL36_12860 [Acidimicrobiales bacterium]